MLKDDAVPELEKTLFLNEYFLKEVPDLKEGINKLGDFVSMKALENDCSLEEKQETGRGQKAKAPLFPFSVDFPYILSGFLKGLWYRFIVY